MNLKQTIKIPAFALDPAEHDVISLGEVCPLIEKDINTEHGFVTLKFISSYGIKSRDVPFEDQIPCVNAS